MLAAGIVCCCGRPPPSREDRDTARLAAPDAGSLDAPTKPPEDAVPTDPDRELSDAMAQLGDEHRQRYGPAMKWLGDHPDRSRPALIRIVEPLEFSMAVYRAIQVLGAIGHPDDVALLARGMNEAGEMLRSRFAIALGNHPNPAALQALIEGTGASSNEVIAAAILGLGVKRDESSRKVLEQLLDHENADVRASAVAGLISLGPGPSRAALKRRKNVEKDRDVLSALREALGKASGT